MKPISALASLLLIISFASCVISGGNPKTRVQKYVKLDTLSNKVIPDSVELFFKGHSVPSFDYYKIARITIKGGRYTTSPQLINLLTEKAKELYCDAIVYIEFDNVKTDYSTINPFWDTKDEEITILEITGLAVKKRGIQFSDSTQKK